MKTILLLLIAILSIFSSCKDKDEPIDKCSNGFLDPGESGIDCGGNCSTPCVPVEPATAFLECNGLPIGITSKTLLYENNNWTLTVGNDTISFQFNLGSNGAIGTYTMNPIGCLAIKNSTYYTNTTDGIFSISAHNLTSKKMSGFFQANFSRNGFTDTLRVTNGQFEFLPY